MRAPSPNHTPLASLPGIHGGPQHSKDPETTHTYHKLHTSQRRIGTHCVYDRRLVFSSLPAESYTFQITDWETVQHYSK